MMPGLDGLEVCRRLKGDPTLPFMPVILVTAKADSRDVVAGLDAGADEYLTKPVDQAALVSRVKSMLRIKALHDTVEEQAAALGEWNRTPREPRTPAGRGARAAGAAEALLLAAARRRDRPGRRRGPAPDAPARGDGGLRRLARLHGVRRGGRARGGHGGPPRVPRRDGAAHPGPRGHARAVHGGRSHGVLQRPDSRARRPGAGGAHGGRHAGPRRRARRDMAPRGVRARPRPRRRPGLRHARRDRLRGALGLRGARHGDQPGGAALRRSPARSDPRRRPGLGGARGPGGRGGPGGDSSQGIPASTFPSSA